MLKYRLYCVNNTAESSFHSFIDAAELWLSSENDIVQFDWDVINTLNVSNMLNDLLRLTSHSLNFEWLKRVRPQQKFN
jgi:hypothetical protein